MERKENIKYFQTYQVNLINHVTHLNLPGIEKASQNQISVQSRNSVHFQPSVHTHSSGSQEKSNASYFAVSERQKIAEYAKLLANQAEKNAKRKVKI